MDDKQLRDLLEYLAGSNFAEFEMEREGFKLRLVKGVRPAAAAPAAPPAPVELPEVPAPSEPPAGAADDGCEAITSPMVGTFYRAPSPNADPFVDVGDRVEAGQVICVIEAMKLMNEIESDRAGEIISIPISNGQPVEYGEVLFRIRPSS